MNEWYTEEKIYHIWVPERFYWMGTYYIYPPFVCKAWLIPSKVHSLDGKRTNLQKMQQSGQDKGRDGDAHNVNISMEGLEGKATREAVNGRKGARAFERQEQKWERGINICGSPSGTGNILPYFIPLNPHRGHGMEVIITTILQTNILRVWWIGEKLHKQVNDGRSRRRVFQKLCGLLLCTGSLFS